RDRRGHEQPMAGILPGDRRALSRLLTPAARGGMAEAVRRGDVAGGDRARGNPRGVALTGGGGGGERPLIGKLIAVIRRTNHSVAVLACDPQSPLTGGALLGDRIRMPNRPDDEGVFIRSVATPSGHSGIAPHADLMIDLLGRHGFDTVIVETV